MLRHNYLARTEQERTKRDKDTGVSPLMKMQYVWKMMDLRGAPPVWMQRPPLDDEAV